ncbi:MAG: porin family protein [Epsilonproteobacteria bacterium]|nr:MAG: porin family protein [Campylobacterota bacterium]
MKKITLSLVSVLALSGLVYAGGDIAPVMEEEQIVVERSPFYLGFGIGGAELNVDATNEQFTSTALMLQAGYQYNEYVAIEGRYSFGFSTDYDQGTTTGLATYGDISSWGIYLKPMYPIGDFSIYGLLGYGGVMLSDIRNGDAYENGFQYGLGASYNITETVSIFADYVWLYDDTGLDYVAISNDVDANVWTLGVSYKF